MRSTFIYLFLLVCLQATAQNQPLSATITSDSSQVIQRRHLETRSFVTESPSTKKSRYLIRGTLKTIGTGLLTYQINRSRGYSVKGVGSISSRRIVPTVGIGLAVGLPDIIKGIKRTPSKRLTAEKIQAPEMEPATVKNVEGTADQIYSGSIVETMSLEEGGDCLGGSSDPCGCRSQYARDIIKASTQAMTADMACVTLVLPPLILPCQAAVLIWYANEVWDATVKRDNCLTNCKE